MATTTDALVAELSLRFDGYKAGINEAVALNQKLRQSVQRDLGGAERDAAQSSERQTTTRKKRSAEEIAAAKAEAAAVR